MEAFDLIVIGGGSAGLKAARTAARQGRCVAVAEERELGGECYWAGCVPTKAMVRAAQVWHTVRHAHEFGIYPEVRDGDFAAAMAYKDRAMHHIGGEGPSDGGLSKLGAKFYHARARFESSHEVRVGDEVITGKNIIVATGTMPAVPPVVGLQETGYITNREAVHLTELPRRLVVLGGGPIGLEFAQIFRRFGAEVTVLEKDTQVLSKEDADIAACAQQFLEEEGIRILTGIECHGVRRVQANGKTEKVLSVAYQGVEEEIFCDEILVAIGRKAAFDGLNIDAAGVEHDERRIKTNRFLCTSVPHIWSAGDVNGGYLFTHVASYEGRLVALNAFTDMPEPFNHRVVPRCTYIDPEVASVGITEKEAQAQGIDTDVRCFHFADLDRAVLANEAKGIVKLILDARDGQICGAHVIGPDASSIIAELVLCMKHHLSAGDIAATMHAYPSFPEAVESAALTPPRYR